MVHARRLHEACERGAKYLRLFHVHGIVFACFLSGGCNGVVDGVRVKAVCWAACVSEAQSSCGVCRAVANMPSPSSAI